MALIHEFERSGNWLFKRRSWLPLLLVICGIVVMNYEDRQAIIFSSTKELIFLGISIFGEVLRIITVGHAPGNTSGRNTAAGQLADEINTTGIYSVIRHPLYVANFFMWLGPVLFLRSFWFTVVFILIYWLYYERIIFAEEQFLRRKFGIEYDEWSENVRAVIPGFRNYTPPRLRFSFKTVLRREYNSFLNIFIIFSALDIIRNYFLSGKFSITPLWIMLVAGAAIVWIIIRAIHKRTQWLTVEGR
jgi:protein-S-isoprenylcysteine O-methyltransferase Ste14